MSFKVIWIFSLEFAKVVTMEYFGFRLLVSILYHHRNRPQSLFLSNFNNFFVYNQISDYFRTINRFSRILMILYDMAVKCFDILAPITAKFARIKGTFLPILMKSLYMEFHITFVFKSSSTQR